ncbi:MAG TPA: transglycosylase SLT domain-containing protein [Rudaea sp.]|nr:transglycosylase SLT domain-containing protein [Rudaea sp.]
MPAKIGARDWRLAALGTSCCTLGVACLTLVACSAAPQRSVSAISPAPPIMIEQPPAPSPLPTVPSTTAIPSDAVIVQSPWIRLRRRMAMPGCDYSPEVRRWARAFTQSPAQFSASMSEAMPYLLVVVNEIEKRDLPGEFAFLPYIESTYTAVAPDGPRAAGIWQLMPDTARETGLRITPEYDGRLDIYASTNAALDLIERYQREFDDWRVVDLAYNAGEYGMKMIVGNPTVSRSVDEIARLRVNQGAHDHLAKLLAVACVASDPERFHIELPEPTSDDLLTHIELDAAVDLNLVAWISGIDETQLRRYNPGYTNGRMPANGPFGLLIPSTKRQKIQDALALLPQPMWRNWHEISLQHDESIDVLATAHDIDARAVASINHVGADGMIAAGKHILLPGMGIETIASSPIEKKSALTTNAVHVVQHGETPWTIARNSHVRLDDLMHWNGLTRKTTLHSGQRLRLQNAESAIGVSTVASGSH